MWIVYGIFSERSNAVPSLVLPIIVLAGPIRGGYDMAMLRLIRGDDSVSFDDLFAGFSKFTSLFVTFLLYILAVIVGILLLIVTGIILLIALWPAFLLVMEDDLAPFDAIMGAWALTRGHKMELFVLLLATFVMLIERQVNRLFNWPLAAAMSIVLLLTTMVLVVGYNKALSGAGSGS